MKHLLTIDVEDPWQGWPDGPGAAAAAPYDLAAALEVILKRLEAINVYATFFVLADNCEEIRTSLRYCVAAGHEVACHGITHERVDTMNPDRFAREIRKAVSKISQVSGAPCRGFRAPWFSAPIGNERYLRALADARIAYDASAWYRLGENYTKIFHAYKVTQIPIPIASLASRRLGILGGLALRLLPQHTLHKLMRACEHAGQPACIYLHPYDWSGVPDLPFSLSRRVLRRRLLTSRALPRLETLSQTFPLTSIARYLLLNQPVKMRLDDPDW